jgi:hypothetical protein
MNDIPLTDAEVAAAAEENVFVQRQPKLKRERKLDTEPLSSDARIAAAIAVHQSYMDEVLAGVIAEVQHKFNQKLAALEQRLNDLAQQLEIERQVTARMAQLETGEHRTVNGRVMNGHG